MIVTIDGPAGTGKSTAARDLAVRLGFSYLDTGAMYRAVGLACLRQNVDLADSAGCVRIVAEIPLRLDGGRTWLGAEEVTAAIRTADATHAASLVAQVPEVRSALVQLQQRIAAGGDFVCEGRDQGTVAFPAAEVKFYVTASPRVRAERRRQELADKGQFVLLEELLQQQADRDRRDAERAVAPLRPAADALQLDTTELSSEQVVDFMERHVRAQLQRRGR